MTKEEKITKTEIASGNTNGNGNNNVSYEAKDIQVLEGLEPVRKRPGMYIGSTGIEGLHHLIWEVFDNSLDEAMAGHAQNIKINLLPNNRIRISDDGRGIPVETHHQTKKSTLETVLTTLHAGGKFGGESYKISGGLHGVGVSVVCALSKWMRAEVARNGKLYAQEYSQGKPTGPVKEVGRSTQPGTTMIFEPDKEIFKHTDFDYDRIINHLRQQSYLTERLRIRIEDGRKLKDGETTSYGFYFEGGVVSYLKYLNRQSTPIQEDIFYIKKEIDNILVEVAFQYNQGSEMSELSFANNIFTGEGGTHLTGFRTALTRCLNDFAREEKYLKTTDENITGDDVREGLLAIIAIKLREPQFEGQTKAKLGTSEARTAVETVMGQALPEWLELHKLESRKIAEKCLLAQKARKAAKAAKETVLKKGMLEGMVLPGKLADCSNRRAEDSELFLVEGESAGGCFLGDTKIALTDGRNLTFKELVEEDKIGKKNYCYTIKADQNIAIGEIKDPRVTRKSAEVIKIILDNNEEIVCTPDHKFMLRNGSYKSASELTSKDSLRPLYRKYSEIGQRITIKGYEMVFDSRKNMSIFTHLLADRFNLEKNIYTKGNGDTIHHTDFNKLNNNPDNLIRMSKMGHLLYHAGILEKSLHREDVKEKARKAHQSKEYREKMKKIMTTPEMKKMLSERAIKQWQNEKYKNYMPKKFLEFYHNNSEYREKNNKRLNEGQKLYWSNLNNRKKWGAQVKKSFEEHPGKRKQFSEIAQQQWNNPILKEWRSETTKKQWTKEFREKRIKAYNQTYLKKALETLYKIYSQNKSIDRDLYNQTRKLTHDKNLIKYETVCSRFFNGQEERLKEAVMNYNHRIKKIIAVNEKFDVYDIEVPETHNFALASGIFVHNSCKMGRDRRFQAILPLKGKIMNVEKSKLDKMLASTEIKALIIALGTGIATGFNLEKIRYHRVIIATDADVDGSHIRTLLLTLFYRHLPKIIEAGYLYIAQPPLYKITASKISHYAYSDNEKDKIVSAIKNTKYDIQRYKGLGEMNPEQLWETTMDPAHRSLKQVVIQDVQKANKIFDILMGEEVAPRKSFIQTYAKEVKNLDA